MIVAFDKEYLYTKGCCSDKKHRYREDIIKRYKRGIDYLKWATRKEDLFRINSLNFESLSGDKKGLFSIRINNQYRIEFSVNESPDEPYLTIIIINMYTLPNVAPDMIANNLLPFEPTHPGELIMDELEARNMTQAKLAENIGVSPSLLNEIIKGKRAVNTEMALMLEAAIDLPADMLLNMQSAYNMQMAKSNSSFMQRLALIRKIAAAL